MIVHEEARTLAARALVDDGVGTRSAEVGKVSRCLAGQLHNVGAEVVAIVDGVEVFVRIRRLIKSDSS